jgi:hypothetical protein
MAKKWMKEAVKKPGSLNAAAKRAGKSKTEFCKTAKGKNKKRCTLWRTFNKYRPK